jgi:hypothetical protein
MTTKTKNNSTIRLVADIPNRALAHDEIALAAYCIWEQEGCPQGRDVDIWLREEDLLLQARKQAAVQG